MGRGYSGMGASSGKVQAKTYALFHGSAKTDITEFDIDKAGTNTESGEKFLFFTDSRAQADDFSYEKIASQNSAYLEQRGAKGRVYEVDVTMNKPLDLSNPSKTDIKNLIKLSGGELDEDQIRRFAKGNNQLLKAYIDLDKISQYGYDGFIAKMNKQGDKEYAVLSSKQTKIKK